MANYLEDLPDLALQRIVDYLDYGSRRTCRLVSWTLKDYMDNTGLSIKLDSRETRSTDLSKTVVATEVRILHLTSYDLEPKEVRKWKTIILSAPVNFTWLYDHLFQNCFQLRVLILNDDALIAEDFIGKLEPIPSLSSLSELHITFGLTCVGLELETINDDPFEFFHSHHSKWETRKQENLAHLLQIIRSRVLKLLYISAPQSYLLIDTGHDYSWEYEQVFEFLQAHSHSLENIILPTLLLLDNDEPELNPTWMNPTHLKRIQLATHSDFGLWLNPDKYWTNLFLSQNSLENISINVRHISDERTFPWLAVVVSNNAKTLIEVSLSLYTDNFFVLDTTGCIGTLDMRLFLVAESLRSLEVRSGSGDYAAIRILNLNDLRNKSLTKLRLIDVMIGADFDGIKFLESSNLNSLHLNAVSAESHFKDPKYTFEFIKLALRSRTLLHFYFCTTKLNYYFPISTVSELRLEPWILQLEAEERLPNLTSVFMERRRHMKPEDPAMVPEGTSISPPMSYMELHNYVEKTSFARFREQPYHLPRNMDSFVVWTNPKTEAYRILPNTKSYYSKVDDMTQLKIYLNVALERNGDTLVGPVGLKDLGVTENALARNDAVTLEFQSDLLEAENEDDG